VANLWRVLALSWLGGIASPALTGDMFPGEVLRPTLVHARAMEVEGLIEVFDLSPGDADRSSDETGPGPSPNEA
jgi:hypothetical protein